MRSTAAGRRGRRMRLEVRSDMSPSIPPNSLPPSSIFNAREMHSRLHRSWPVRPRSRNQDISQPHTAQSWLKMEKKCNKWCMYEWVTRLHYLKGQYINIFLKFFLHYSAIASSICFQKNFDFTLWGKQYYGFSKNCTF